MIETDMSVQESLNRLVETFQDIGVFVLMKKIELYLEYSKTVLK